MTDEEAAGAAGGRRRRWCVDVVGEDGGRSVGRYGGEGGGDGGDGAEGGGWGLGDFVQCAGVGEGWEVFGGLEELKREGVVGRK